ncbi:hypothetical protein JCM3774_004580 [Rhodotorula dairenensis]
MAASHQGGKRPRSSYGDPYRQDLDARPLQDPRYSAYYTPAVLDPEPEAYTSSGYAYPPRYPYMAEYVEPDRRYSQPSAPLSHDQQNPHSPAPPPVPYDEPRHHHGHLQECGWRAEERPRLSLHSPAPPLSATQQPSFPILTSAVHHPRPSPVTYPPSSWEYSPRPTLRPESAYYPAPPSLPPPHRGPSSLSAETVFRSADVPDFPATRSYYPEEYPAPSALPPPLAPPRPAYLQHPVPVRRASFDAPTEGVLRPPQVDAAGHTLGYPTPSPPGAIITPVPVRSFSQPALPFLDHHRDREEEDEDGANRTLATLQAASRERDAHRTAAPILAFNPAREPSATGKQLVESPYGVTYAVAASGQSKGKAKSAEVTATCWSCNLPRAKCIMRGSDLGGWTPRVQFQCLDCLPIEETNDPAAARAARDERLAARAFEEFQQQSTATAAPASHTSTSPPVAAAPPQHEHDRITFRDTFSGAVDEIVRSQATPGAAAAGDDVAAPPSNSRLLLPPEETAKGLSASFKRQAMCCDVCSRVIGAGSVESLDAGPAPSFTVEVICRTCLDRYRACSDCGGGGGRLTPGRWRCKELFPANRRTCTLSHARNPPLADIDYDVLRITEIDPAKVASLDDRLRKIYYNVRMRMQARPEMLERGDGLATTFAQVEKLIVDGWTLLRPLLTVDVEATRGLRRYVALQTSTPHKRRAKPKPGAIPKPEPVVPKLLDPVEREVSGFLLLEHQLETGAVHVAVTMPWAISGDAFDATTILLDETLRRVRLDLLRDNMLRAERSGGREPPYPDPTYLWGITPFKSDSRMTQSLTRRGFHFLEDRLREDPTFDVTIFPPHRTVHVPNEFMRSFRIFLRDVTEEDGSLSTSSEQQHPAAVGTATHVPRPPPKKRARHLKAKTAATTTTTTR